MEEAEKKEMEQLITAVYKLHLHCKECARAVEKYITSAPGILKVDVDMESGKVTVKGIFDPKKLHEKIEKKCKRKVEWISPKPVEIDPKSHNMPKKEETVRTTHIYLRMHCEKCKEDLRNILLKHKGIESVKMDMKEQSCVIVGVVEEKKLLKYIHRKTGKRGKIIEQKQEKNETKEVAKVEVEVMLPCFMYCNHAPQWFSDENPNACSFM